MEHPERSVRFTLREALSPVASAVTDWLRVLPKADRLPSDQF